jgi:hypothetical protein
MKTMKELIILLSLLFSFPMIIAADQSKAIWPKFPKDDPHAMRKWVLCKTAAAAQEQRNGTTVLQKFCISTANSNNPCDYLIEALRQSNDIEKIFGQFFPEKRWEILQQLDKGNLTPNQLIGFRIAEKIGPKSFAYFMRVSNVQFAITVIAALQEEFNGNSDFDGWI